MAKPEFIKTMINVEQDTVSIIEFGSRLKNFINLKNKEEIKEDDIKQLFKYCDDNQKQYFYNLFRFGTDFALWDEKIKLSDADMLSVVKKNYSKLYGYFIGFMQNKFYSNSDLKEIKKCIREEKEEIYKRLKTLEKLKIEEKVIDFLSLKELKDLETEMFDKKFYEALSFIYRDGVTIKLGKQKDVNIVAWTPRGTGTIFISDKKKCNEIRIITDLFNPIFDLELKHELQHKKIEIITTAISSYFHKIGIDDDSWYYDFIIMTKIKKFLKNEVVNIFNKINLGDELVKSSVYSKHTRFNIAKWAGYPYYAKTNVDEFLAVVLQDESLYSIVFDRLIDKCFDGDLTNINDKKCLAKFCDDISISEKDFEDIDDKKFRIDNVILKKGGWLSNYVRNKVSVTDSWRELVKREIDNMTQENFVQGFDYDYDFILRNTFLSAIDFETGLKRYFELKLRLKVFKKIMEPTNKNVNVNNLVRECFKDFDWQGIEEWNVEDNEKEIFKKGILDKISKYFSSIKEFEYNAKIPVLLSNTDLINGKKFDIYDWANKGFFQFANNANKKGFSRIKNLVQLYLDGQIDKVTLKQYIKRRIKTTYDAHVLFYNVNENLYNEYEKSLQRLGNTNKKCFPSIRERITDEYVDKLELNKDELVKIQELGNKELIELYADFANKRGRVSNNINNREIEKQNIVKDLCKNKIENEVNDLHFNSEEEAVNFMRELLLIEFCLAQKDYANHIKDDKNKVCLYIPSGPINIKDVYNAVGFPNMIIKRNNRMYYISNQRWWGLNKQPIIKELTALRNKNGLDVEVGLFNKINENNNTLVKLEGDYDSITKKVIKSINKIRRMAVENRWNNVLELYNKKELRTFDISAFFEKVREGIPDRQHKDVKKRYISDDNLNIVFNSKKYNNSKLEDSKIITCNKERLEYSQINVSVDSKKIKEDKKNKRSLQFDKENKASDVIRYVKNKNK